MKLIHSTSLVLSLLFCAACATNSLGHRPTVTNPDERLATLVAEYERAKTAKHPGTDADQILVDADRVWNQLERLSLEFPRHVPTLVTNAAIALENHQAEKAESYCDLALSLSPVHPAAAILKAQLSIAANNLPAARRLLAAQVEYSPDHAQLRETYAAVLCSAAAFGPAKNQLAIAERLGAPAWRVAFNRGLIAEAEKDSARAAQEYEACLSANPGYVPAQARLAGMKAEGGVQ